MTSKLSQILAALLLTASSAVADVPVLTVYTYDSFVSEWGPGPSIKAAFEKTCDCSLEFVGVGDGAALLARLQLEGARSDADVVLGLDTNLTARAKATGLFAPHNVKLFNDHGVRNPIFTLPVTWEDPTFLPFDWGYFSFVYDNTKLSDVPTSFADLSDRDDLKIVIQDPRSSTPGLGLLMWIKAAYGDDAGSVWEGLSPRILTVTKGWTEAYGMFLSGEADMVLSYTTSPAYHVVAEGDESKSAAIFDEGHYIQIEVVGKLASSDQPELADAFLDFMISAEAQNILPTTNWMYPAALGGTDLPEAFVSPVADDKALFFDPETAQSLRDPALAEWLTALNR